VPVRVSSKEHIETIYQTLNANPPHVFNHNMETALRFYKKARPGANYQWSLDLLKKSSWANPNVPTKSGLMVGLG